MTDNPMRRRADAYVAKTFKIASPATVPTEDQSKLRESLQAVQTARERVLKMFGKS